MELLAHPAPEKGANLTGMRYEEAFLAFLATTARAQSSVVETEACMKQKKGAVRRWAIRQGPSASGTYLQAGPVPDPGRYFVWMRAYATGPKDNSIHAGLNSQWPEAGKRRQRCEGKRAWTWASKQRTATSTAVNRARSGWMCPPAGEHIVNFSLREDGFLVTTDPRHQP